MLARNLGEKIIDEVWNSLLKPALDKESVHDPKRASMRWDVIDTIAYWDSSDEIARHIHAWLVGEWPRFELRYEGAAWKDEMDADGLERRKYAFYQPDVDSARVELLGPNEDPTVQFLPSEEDLIEELGQLIRRVCGAKLEDVGSETARTVVLPPVLRREGHRTPEFQ